MRQNHFHIHFFGYFALKMWTEFPHSFITDIYEQFMKTTTSTHSSDSMRNVKIGFLLPLLCVCVCVNETKTCFWPRIHYINLSLLTSFNSVWRNFGFAWGQARSLKNGNVYEIALYKRFLINLDINDHLVHDTQD